MINFFKFVYRLLFAWLIHPKVYAGQIWHLIYSDHYCKILYVDKYRIGYSFYLDGKTNLSTGTRKKNIFDFCWIYELDK